MTSMVYYLGRSMQHSFSFKLIICLLTAVLVSIIQLYIQITEIKLFLSNSNFISYQLSFLAPFVRFKLHLEVPQL